MRALQSLAARNFSCWQLLPQWCGILIVERSYTASKGDAQPLAFDLSDSPHGLQPARIVKAGESMRYLAMFR